MKCSDRGHGIPGANGIPRGNHHSDLEGLCSLHLPILMFLTLQEVNCIPPPLRAPPPLTTSCQLGTLLHLETPIRCLAVIVKIWHGIIFLVFSLFFLIAWSSSVRSTLNSLHPGQIFTNRHLPRTVGAEPSVEVKIPFARHCFMTNRPVINPQRTSARFSLVAFVTSPSEEISFYQFSFLPKALNQGWQLLIQLLSECQVIKICSLPSQGYKCTPNIYIFIYCFL